jgi:hypothetical protein
MNELIREIKTKDFTIRVTAEEEYTLDLSFDEDGSIEKLIEAGELGVFCAKAECFFKGVSISTDYLGQCIYKSVAEFQDHKGCRPAGHGSYFSDMVRTVVGEARDFLKDCSEKSLTSRTT